METIFITNIPHRAEAAQIAGVDRIMVDLEILGKMERQSHLDTVISRHNLSDVRSLRALLSKTSLMVRVNPIHAQSAQEIDEVIAAGADILMLPMFRTISDAEQFVSMVGERARTCLLFETAEALDQIENLARIGGIDEAHIGLNDLHLSLGLTFMFELLSGGIVEYMAGVFRSRGVKFGIGGVARLGRGILPAELILSEHIRLGSSQVILSRDYAKVFEENSQDDAARVFAEETHRLHKYVSKLKDFSPEQLAFNSNALKDAVDQIVASRHYSNQEALASRTQSRESLIGTN